MAPAKGDEVYHRADPRRIRSIVITTGAVVVRRIEDGAHVVAAYDPDELKVVGQPTWKRGPLSDGERATAVSNFCRTCYSFVVEGGQERCAGGLPLVRRKDLAKTPRCVGYIDARPDPEASPRPFTTAARAEASELGPLCKRCSSEPAEGEACAESRGALKEIAEDGVRRCAGFVLATADPEDSVDVPLPGIHGKRCVSCNSWGADGCSQGRPCAPDGSSKACDEWALTRNPWHPTKRSEICVGAYHKERCFTCDSWRGGGCKEGMSGVAPNGSGLACHKWTAASELQAEPPTVNDDDVPLRDVMPATTGEPGPYDGQPVPERAELDVEDARETLEGAGWFMISPKGRVTSLGNIKNDSPAWAAIVDSCSSILIKRGRVVFRHDGDEYSALPLPDEYEAAILKGVDAEKLAAELVFREWAVFEPEGDAEAICGGCGNQSERWCSRREEPPQDGSRLYPPGQPATTGGQPREITEDTLEAVKGHHCIICDHWPGRTTRDHVLRCAYGNETDGPRDSCDEWIRTEPAQARELAWLTVTDLALEEARAVLKAAGYTVVAQSELPDPGCYVCRYWDSEAPEPCTKDMTPDYDDPQPCDRFQHRWQDVAEHLSAVIAKTHVGELDEEPQPETEQPPAPAYPTPPIGLGDDTLAAQLDWLRANDLPTGKGAGRKSKTTMVVKLLRLRYYDPATVEQLTGELQWPPGPAKCPVVEDGEPCGSETPESCEHSLP